MAATLSPFAIEIASLGRFVAVREQERAAEREKLESILEKRRQTAAARTAADLLVNRKAILAVIGDCLEWKTMDLMRAARINSFGAYSDAIKSLVEEGLASRKGQDRSTRYFATKRSSHV